MKSEPRSTRRISVEQPTGKRRSSAASIQERLTADKKANQVAVPRLLKKIDDIIAPIFEKKESEDLINKITELQPTIVVEIVALLKTRSYLKDNAVDEKYVIFAGLGKLTSLLKIDSPVVKKFCGDIYFLVGNYNDAKTQYREISKKNSEPLVYLRLVEAELARAKQDDNKLIECCSAIIGSQNKKYCADAYFLLAEYHFKKGEYPDAKTNLRLASAAKKNPDSISCDDRTEEIYKKLETSINNEENIEIKDSWENKKNKAKVTPVTQSSGENPMAHLEDEKKSAKAEENSAETLLETLQP